ncbi:MAG: hypothetical protein KA072_11480 [Thermoanaerobaculaceae bacterium]|nr:hypothetical protein [Thermoanaerobaculaceae bacterium]MDI9622134.1 hypothetical protein [Acidobacteriota bacterium]NLH12105.1 hypothetical protein [Holophagae bacterium]HPW56132.1 hypothetical protein [Thermoanaerobaculaceae bacterium]
MTGRSKGNGPRGKALSGKVVELARPAEPAIAKVFDEFLTEKRRELGAKTIRQYEDVICLLRGHLDGCAYESLSKPERALWERAFNAEGEAHREFCDLFGPEKIPEHLDGFFGYFMIRKVIAGPALVRAAGTVTKKLSAWLAAKGYIEAEAARKAAERSSAASRDLPRADRAAKILYEAASRVAVNVTTLPDSDYLEFDHFIITRIEPGKLWLEVWEGGKPEERGPISVPRAATDLLCPGWWLSCALARVGKSWHIVEMTNVYPD